MDHKEIDESIVREMNIEGLEVLEWIGGGYFSNVYKGIINDEMEVAIKVISEDEGALKHEISILQRIKGCPHTSQVIDIPGSQEYPVILLKYERGISTKDVINRIDLPSLKSILKSLFECLNGIHHRQIVHQDIKLTNLIVSSDFKEVVLSDWGCGHIISDNLSPLVGSRLNRSPEMLIGAKNYREKGDIWAVGVLILNLLCDEKLPWNASNSDKELVEMSKIFGGNNLISCAEKILGLKIKSNISDSFSIEPSLKLDAFFSEKFKKLQSPLLIDLMNSLLTLDMNKRPTAEEALNHDFFK